MISLLAKVGRSDYFYATSGLEGLTRVFDNSSKRLAHTFGPNGNPRASKLFALNYYLLEQERVTFGCESS